MGDIQWGLLDQNAFQTGYKQGKAPFDEMEERRKQAMKEAALRQYALHPDDPKSLNALAIADPTLAITARQTQETARLKGLDAHRDSIKVGAQIIRQINPKDDATWQQALVAAKQAGVDLTGVPQHFDPQYVQGLIATADALSPEKTASQPNIQREHDYYVSIGKPELAEQLLQHHAEGPPVMVDNGDGTKTLYPRAALAGQAAAQGGSPQPGTVEDGYRFKGGDPANPANWEQVGGQTVAPSGGFP